MLKTNVGENLLVYDGTRGEGTLVEVTGMATIPEHWSTLEPKHGCAAIAPGTYLIVRVVTDGEGVEPSGCGPEEAGASPVSHPNSK